MLAAILSIIVTVADAPPPSPWDDPAYRNAEGYRVCKGWIDATPERREQMPEWCADWATGDI